MLEPSEIDNKYFLFKMIACTLKVRDGFMSRGAREKETHYGDPSKLIRFA